MVSQVCIGKQDLLETKTSDAQEDPEYILRFQSDDVKRVMGSLNTSAATEAFESGGGGAKAQVGGSHQLVNICKLGDGRVFFWLFLKTKSPTTTHTWHL